VLIINLSKSVTNADKAKPKINLDCLFSGMFFRSGDHWVSHKILLGQVPSVQELAEANTVFISGSTYSVNSMHSLIRKFATNLMKALEANKHLKVMGSCFGHQLIAQSFGGRVEKRSLARGPEVITSVPHDLESISYLANLNHGEAFNLKMYEFHSDYVVTLPPGFSCIANSPSCENEIVVSDDKRIFTFQFHPEYTVEYIQAVEQRWGREDGLFQGIHQGSYAYDEEHHRTVASFRRTIRAFLDWECPQY
jgi:GMP synthase-like glutamine amidotransferase